MKNDTVFNKDMRIVFSDEPHVVLRRLKHPYPETWSKVCIGDTELVVTIPEYLYRDTYKEVQGMLRGLVEQSKRPLYKRDPDRMDIHVQQLARKIIELVQKDLT
jgi:hypothetical protein